MKKWIVEYWNVEKFRKEYVIFKTKREATDFARRLKRYIKVR